MQSLKLFCLILGLGAVSSAQADFIGVKASIDYWNYSTDLNNPASALPQPQLEDDHGMSFSVAVEHPVPFLPNAKIKHSNLQAESDQSFAGVKSHQVDLDYSDFILYYEILDNVVSADVGFGAKLLDGDLQQNFTQNTEISETLPMLYAEAGGKTAIYRFKCQSRSQFCQVNRYTSDRRSARTQI